MKEKDQQKLVSELVSFISYEYFTIIVMMKKYSMQDHLQLSYIMDIVSVDCLANTQSPAHLW